MQFLKAPFYHRKRAFKGINSGRFAGFIQDFSELTWSDPTCVRPKDDPRILKGVGNFLRKSSLDELPQLWNVLRGEMSLGGPRPFPHYHLEQFEGDFRRMRRRVLPGMTGLWQVSARSDGDLAVQAKLDTYYILNWSIWLDLSLLCHTFQAVVSRKGAY